MIASIGLIPLIGAPDRDDPNRGQIAGATMLHDGITQRRLETPSTTERRSRPRVPFPSELVIIWHCSMPDSTRYAVIDVSDSGFRIRSSVPLVEGMTGTASRMLPEGHPLNVSLRVVWCRPDKKGDGYHAGLQRL